MTFYNQTNSIWNDAMKARHRQLWATGYSASAIRDTINGEFKTELSRNAIIGMTERANLPKRKSSVLLAQHKYTEQQLNLIRSRAAKGETQRQIAAAVFAKYGVRVSENSIGSVMRRNKIRGNTRHHGMGRSSFAKRPTVRAKPATKSNGGRGYWYAPFDSAKELLRDDPISDIGLSLLNLRANSCRYPIAREPGTLAQRFCGEARMMDGEYFASSYCEQHHMRCHKPQIVREAAE